jgi:hypothetical protein
VFVLLSFSISVVSLSFPLWLLITPLVFSNFSSNLLQYTCDIRRKFEDTKGVIRSCKSKKDRKYNGQKKKNKMTNNDLQNTTQQTKDGGTQTPLKSQEW